MISLFENIYPDRRLVSTNQLQILLKQSQQDLMNGLVEISYSPEDKLLLLLNSGNITCAYECKGNMVTRSPLSNLSILLSNPSQSHIRICELAPSFLHAIKTIVEQPEGSNTLLSSTTALPDIMQQYRMLPEPSLLHVRWPHAEGFVFLPGNNFSPRQYAFLTEDQSSDSVAAVSMFSRWSETECTVSQYIGDSQTEIWKENNLQFGFAILIEQIIHRYEELVGHALSRKLEDSLNRLSQMQSWNISIANNTVHDVQLFDSINDAALAYKMLLDLASRQINVVIGSRLFNEALETGLDSLSKQLRQAVEDNYLVAVTQLAV
jgi:hypothetical protein